MDIINNKTEKLLELEMRTGYQLTQTNGERRFGPPPNWEGPPPPRGNAENAIQTLNDFELIPGFRIGVVKSVDNRKLFFGGIPKDKNKEDILEELNKHVDGIKEIILYKNHLDATKSRGFAFVEFESHKSAAMARRKLLTDRILLWGIGLQVDWALPEREIDEDVMRKVTVLFIRDLLLSTTEKTLYGAMQSVVARDTIVKIKKLRNFAFVHFTDRENAQKCLDYWNGKTIDSAIIEVRWARPSEKEYRCMKSRVQLIQ
ncbi:hypothetical protein L9F63_007933, partial [Diploptera punctata]